MAFSIEQQRKRARELLRAARAGDTEAVGRLRAHHPRFGAADPAGARLADAQLVVARELGFPSWPRLVAAAAGRERPIVRELSYYDERAQGLVSVHAQGLPEGFRQIREWHPRFSGASDEEIRAAAFTLDDARLVYARQHGFADWDGFGAHLAALERGEAEEPFVAAFEAIKGKERDRLVALLRQHPDLVHARGTNGNTLLHLADDLETVRTLLAAGADPRVPNDRGWTLLHQAGYGNSTELAAPLIEAGAAVDAVAYGDGGTPLVVALFWGHREVSELLAARGVVPGNLRTAAGLGRRALIEALVGRGGSLAPEAGAHRGFYRPHTGFPVWRPSDDPQEVLDEALVWACKADRVDVLPMLVARGADLEADPYRGTPLLWAAFKGRLGAARWLLDQGAGVNRRATFGGPSHGQGVTALHLAVQRGDLDMVRLLLERGGDPTVEDDLYGSSIMWAGHFGHDEVLAMLRGA